jgi:hypothetical protein
MATGRCGSLNASKSVVIRITDLESIGYGEGQRREYGMYHTGRGSAFGNYNTSL